MFLRGLKVGVRGEGVGCEASRSAGRLEPWRILGERGLDVSEVCGGWGGGNGGRGVGALGVAAA